MLQDVKCKRIDKFEDKQCVDPVKQGCTKIKANCPKILSKEDIKKFQKRIRENYEAQL
jgi:predicted RNA-binding protein